MSSYYGNEFADNSGSLSHWGIEGMKWGVRRYQNYDGTLTPEGRARYGKDISLFDKERFGGVKLQVGRHGSNSQWRNTNKNLTRTHNRMFRKPGSYKDFGDIMTDLASAQLKDIGYEDSESNRKWLMDQDWWIEGSVKTISEIMPQYRGLRLSRRK